MDPQVLDPVGWSMIAGVIERLTVFVVLMILSAFSLLLSRAVLPSLVTTHQLTDGYLGYRRVLAVVGVVGFILAIIQLVRIVGSIIAVLQPYYPRWGF